MVQKNHNETHVHNKEPHTRCWHQASVSIPMDSYDNSYAKHLVSMNNSNLALFP